MDKPEKNNAGGNDIASMRARATVRGMKVPRSPKEPLTSLRVSLERKVRGCARGRLVLKSDTIGTDCHIAADWERQVEDHVLEGAAGRTDAI